MFLKMLLVKLYFFQMDFQFWLEQLCYYRKYDFNYFIMEEYVVVVLNLNFVFEFGDF